MRVSRFITPLLILTLLSCEGRRALKIGTDAGRDLLDSETASAPADAPSGLVDGTTASIPVDAPSGLAEASGIAADSGVDGTGSCGSQISFHIGSAADVDPATLCLYGCDGLSVVMSSGQTQFAVSTFLVYGIQAVWSPGQTSIGCAVLCDGCSQLLCPPCPLAGSVPARGLDRAWDGTFSPDDGTCNGKACVGPARCAPPGHYSAQFCVPRGITVNKTCVLPSVLGSATSNTSYCTTVAFDLPSTTTLSVELGGSDRTTASIDGGNRTVELAGLPGNYNVKGSLGGITDGMGKGPIQFDVVPFFIALGTDSDLLVTTNPLPTDFSGTCSIPMNATRDADGNLLLENLATTCTDGSATITQSPSNYQLAPQSGTGNLSLYVLGTITGATRENGQLGFAYSGEVDALQ